MPTTSSIKIKTCSDLEFTKIKNGRSSSQMKGQINDLTSNPTQTLIDLASHPSRQLESIRIKP